MLSRDPRGQHFEFVQESKPLTNLSNRNQFSSSPLTNHPLNEMTTPLHHPTPPSLTSSPDQTFLNDGISNRSNRSQTSQPKSLSLEGFVEELQKLKVTTDKTSEQIDCGILRVIKKNYGQVGGFIVSFISFGLIFLVLTILGTIVLVNYQYDSNKRVGIEKVKLAEGNIGKQLTKTFNSLLVMKDQVQNWNYSITLAKFNGLSTRLSWGHPEVYNFEYALGPNASLDYIYPPVEAVYGLNMGFDSPNHKSAMNEAIQKNETTIYGPISLIEGGVAVIAQHPIFYLNGTFFGFAVELCRLDRLFNSINFTGLLLGYQYQLFDYYNGSVFLQSLDGHSEFESTLNRNVSIISDSIFTNISVYNCRWKIILKPIKGWNDNSILWAEIIIAILMIFLPAFTFAPLFSFIFSKCMHVIRYDMSQTKACIDRFGDEYRRIEDFRDKWERFSELFKERTRKLEESIKHSPIACINASLDGRIQSVNLAFTHFFGYYSDSIKDTNLNEVFLDFDIQKIYETKPSGGTKTARVTIISQKDPTDSQQQFPINIAFQKSSKDETILVSIYFSSSDRIYDSFEQVD